MSVDFGKAVSNTLKGTLGYYMHTILLFSFQQIKRDIRRILILLLVICLIVDIWSMIEIFTRNRYFVRAVVSQRFRIWAWLMYFCSGY